MRGPLHNNFHRELLVRQGLRVGQQIDDVLHGKGHQPDHDHARLAEAGLGLRQLYRFFRSEGLCPHETAGKV